MEATSTSALQGETLRGDIRDRFGDLIRGIDKPWTKMSEAEQRRLNNRVDTLSLDLIRGAVEIVYNAGFPLLEGQLSSKGKWKDGAMELTLTVPLTEANVGKITHHGGGASVLQLVDADVFFGERRPAQVDKDQPDLDLPADSAPPAWEQQWRDIQAAKTLEGVTVDLREFPAALRDEVLELAVGKGAVVMAVEGEAAERAVQFDAERGAIIDPATGEVLATVADLRAAIESETAPLAGITVDPSQFPEDVRVELIAKARAKGATILGEEAGESGEHVEAAEGVPAAPMPAYPNATRRREAEKLAEGRKARGRGNATPAPDMPAPPKQQVA